MMSDYESKKLKKKFVEGVKDAQKEGASGGIIDTVGDIFPTFLPPSKEYLSYRAGKETYRRGEIPQSPSASERERISYSSRDSGNDSASDSSVTFPQVIWIVSSTIGEFWALYMLGAPDKFTFSWFPFIIAVICAPGALIGNLILLIILVMVSAALAIISMVVMLVAGLVYFLIKSITG